VKTPALILLVCLSGLEHHTSWKTRPDACMYHKTYTRLEIGHPPLSRWKDSYKGYGTVRFHMTSGEWGKELLWFESIQKETCRR
ncbi:mCG1037350, partial [Mus musculus]